MPRFDGRIQEGKSTTLVVGRNNSLFPNVADYVADGTADDVEVQAAVNALPSTGGRVILLDGTYNWAVGSTVSRAINNVTIMGQGASTILNRNAADPVITVGAQNDWIMANFATDAGGVSIASAVRPIRENIIVNGTAQSSRDSMILDLQLLINTSTARHSTSGATIRTASANSTNTALVLEQVNTGTSAGVALGMYLYDSTSVAVQSAVISSKKRAAWTNGDAATFDSDMIFQVLQDNVLTTYLSFDAISTLLAVNMPRSLIVGASGLGIQNSLPGITVNTLSQNAVSRPLSIAQVNTGTNAGVSYHFLLADSASANHNAGEIIVQKADAWTNGVAATIDTSMFFQVAEDDVLTSYLTLNGNAAKILASKLFELTNAIGAPAALANTARLGAADFAADDARLAVQSEAGSVIYVGNDTVRATWATQAVADATVDLGAVTGSTYSLVRITSSLRHKAVLGPFNMNSRAIYDIPLYEWESRTGDYGKRGYSPIAEYTYAANPSFAQIDEDGLPIGINWYNLNTAILAEIQKHEIAIQELKQAIRS